jgi:hypothetical protein
MKRTRLLMFASALALAAATGACRAGEDTQVEAKAGSELGINPAAIDKSVTPGDDFYNYANGAWMKETEIPADRSSVGGFFIADQEREKNTRELFDAMLKGDHDAGSSEGRIGNYYTAYLDTAAIDRAGIAPARADLDAIGRIGDKRALSAAIGGTLRADVDPLNATNYQTDNLFGIFVTQGLSTPGETLPYMLQGGLGMPEREYYLSGDGKMGELRGQYKSYIETVMKAAGHADAAGAANRIMALETKIAQAHATRAESEDFAKGATVWTRAELERNAPGVDWGALLGAAQLGNAPKFQAYHAGAIPRLAALVGSEPLDAWKEWLAFHTLSSNANVLGNPIRDSSFAFFGNRAQRHPGAAAARHPGAQRDQQRASRRGRQGLCRQIFPGVGQGPGPGYGRRDQDRFRQARGGARLDGAFDQTRGAQESGIDRRRGRLSRQLARLFGRDDQRDRRLRQPESGKPRGISAPDRQDRQADGPQRMVDAAAAGQRGQFAGAECAQFPGGDPGPPVFRSQGRRGVQLWRHRQRHRPRDQPQLRQ